MAAIWQVGSSIVLVRHVGDGADRWALPGGPVRAGETLAEAVVRTSASDTATDVLCQTGCQGHAHPWLDADGSCRLTGGDCTRVRDAVPAGAPEDQSAYR